MGHYAIVFTSCFGHSLIFRSSLSSSWYHSDRYRLNRWLHHCFPPLLTHHFSSINLEIMVSNYYYSLWLSFYLDRLGRFFPKVLGVILDENLHIFPVFIHQNAIFLSVRKFILFSHFSPNCACLFSCLLMCQVLKEMK